MTQLLNWAGNYTYRAARLHAPSSVEEVRGVVRGAERVKVLGSRHSFNGVADTEGDLISLEQLDGVLALDSERRTVTVAGGVRYGELTRFLHARGWALPNLASLPHISVAGACATATHGSGDGQGNLATSVCALEVVTAGGEVAAFSRDTHGETFAGTVVSLGGLGVVTQLTLKVVPAFELRQDVYEELPLAQLEAHFDAVTGGGYSVSLFTDWQRDGFYQVWRKRRAEDGDVGPGSWFGATPAPQDRHPIAGLSAVNCTQQRGVPGPWHERLPHFRLAYTPSSGEELQSEYFVPREHALGAFRAVRGVGAHLAPLLQVSEVRTVAADDLWLSPCYRQDSVALHFTWRRDEAALRALLPRLEDALAPFGVRPHWGKVFTLTPLQVRSGFARLPDFRRLLQVHDPQGKFHNAFLDAYIFTDD